MCGRFPFLIGSIPRLLSQDIAASPPHRDATAFHLSKSRLNEVVASAEPIFYAFAKSLQGPTIDVQLIEREAGNWSSTLEQRRIELEAITPQVYASYYALQMIELATTLCSKLRASTSLSGESLAEEQKMLQSELSSLLVYTTQYRTTLCEMLGIAPTFVWCPNQLVAIGSASDAVIEALVNRTRLQMEAAGRTSLPATELLYDRQRKAMEQNAKKHLDRMAQIVKSDIVENSGLSAVDLLKQCMHLKFSFIFLFPFPICSFFY